MQVTKEQIEPCKVAVTMTFEPVIVRVAREKAFQQAIKSITLPGFRKGHVPPAMARQYVDQTQVKQRAAEQLIQANYEQAIQEADVKPFAQGDIELVEMNDDGPLVVKALIPLPPVVTLGPYKGLEMERRRPEIVDADVDKQIEEARIRLSQFPIVKGRSVMMGDLVLSFLGATVFARPDTDEEDDDTDARETVIEVGRNVPDFDNALIGMEVGEFKEIDVTYPDDYEDERLRGRQAQFDVDVREIRERALPALDAVFAKEVHPNVNSMDELRVVLRETLEKAADRMADMDLESRLLGTIIQNSQIYYPDILLRTEMASDIEQLQERLQANSIDLEHYLDENAITEQELEQQIAQNADGRIRNSLILSQISQQEQIRILPADLDVQINRRAEMTKVSPAAVRAYAEKNGQIEQMQNVALTEKIMGYLKDASNITDRFITREELANEPNAAETEQAIVGISEEIVDEAHEASQTAPLMGNSVPLVKRRMSSVIEETAE